MIARTPGNIWISIRADSPGRRPLNRSRLKAKAAAEGTYTLEEVAPRETELTIDLTLTVDLPLPQVAAPAVGKVMQGEVDAGRQGREEPGGPEVAERVEVGRGGQLRVVDLRDREAVRAVGGPVQRRVELNALGIERRLEFFQRRFDLLRELQRVKTGCLVDAEDHPISTSFLAEKCLTKKQKNYIISSTYQ